jgi:hypothetical protein
MLLLNYYLTQTHSFSLENITSQDDRTTQLDLTLLEIDGKLTFLRFFLI